MPEVLSARRIPELDGVRGLAILLVLAVHFGLTANPPEPLYSLLRLGWSGVDLFFVLSGFLITGILLDTASSPNYFRAFYMRRALRIFPLYYAYIAAFFFVVLPLTHALNRPVPPGPAQGWYWFYLSNWRSALGPDYAFLSHLWSLSIEEQFYLVWPPLVLWLGRRRLPILCAALIMAAPLLRFVYRVHPYSPEFLYRLTPFRVDTLAWGALLAVIVRNEPWLNRFLAWAGPLAAAAVAGLAGIFAFCGTKNSQPVVAVAGYTLLAILYFLVVFSGFRGWAPLRTPLLRTFGKYSYGVYVLHFPLVGYLYLAMDPVARAVGRVPAALCAFALGSAIALGLARISWLLIERRFLAWKDRFQA
ncbi:acyltransferase [uncultured Paludibaculum sp.]|uniref:acyltransferase family protein n=1 Tax=uncultured Paludibaculum sp. TaxID=1765020 RepID=UPI002AAAD776|nr:acyltransferase [uncultured Paludibaculum sp.]